MHRSLRCVAMVSLIGAATLSLPGASNAAPAQPSQQARDEAQRRFAQGKELYEENDFRGALNEFNRAWQLAPNYKLLYTIAQVQFQLQDYAAALRSFEQYLSGGGAEIPEARRAEVQKEIDRLAARVAKLEISTNLEGAVITVDDVEVGTTPLPEPVLVSAGRRRITATRGRATASRLVDLAGGDQSRITLDLTESAPPVALPAQTAAAPRTSAPTALAPTPAAAAEQPQGSVPWAAWALTGGLAACATVTGVLALRASSDLADKRETPEVGSDALQSASDRTSSLALATDILAAAAIVSGGISLWFTLDSPGPAGSPSAQVGLSPGRLTLSGRF